MNIKILLNVFFTFFLINFPCSIRAHEDRVKINLDSVGEVTVARSRILGIARTARGPNYAAYILIVPNGQERLAGVTKIVIMSNIVHRNKPQCRLVKSESDTMKTSCSLALANKDILAILTFDRAGSVDDLLPVLGDSTKDLDRTVRIGLP